MPLVKNLVRIPSSEEIVRERLKSALRLLNQARKISDEEGLTLNGNKLGPFIQIGGIEQVLNLLENKED
jgi:hypothetical protein